MLSALSRTIVTDISYVSDRLAATIRADAAKASPFSVVGVMSGPHMMLGGAIQMQGDSRWHQLFPIELLRVLSRSLIDSAAQQPPMLRP